MSFLGFYLHVVLIEQHVANNSTPALQILFWKELSSGPAPEQCDWEGHKIFFLRIWGKRQKKDRFSNLRLGHDDLSWFHLRMKVYSRLGGTGPKMLSNHTAPVTLFWGTILAQGEGRISCLGGTSSDLGHGPKMLPVALGQSQFTVCNSKSC